MPLILKEKIGIKGLLGVWRIEEEAIFFEQQLNLFETELEELMQLSERKRIEWLASRYLLHLLLGTEDRTPCLKDRYGKPHLMDTSLEISLSHSRDLVAVVFEEVPCGVDIQYLVNKIHRIGKKFVNEFEIEMTEGPQSLLNMHAIWGAKESIYKAHGRKGVDFKNEIRIDPFLFDANGFTFDGLLQRETFSEEFSCHARLFEDFVLVYAKQV
ncbi:MAG: 4'-phosphopantetheinyl transferase superfamily protein [Saprospiraceae bacterium]|mgnify:FL=1|nr:4'-phosphopantetheinyl transferase superfamily protein [Saprospiraceae bacterium]MBK8632867.1 4'-phosphopantetheinyl transferase superfamily protein [Saprospiraceae bacterium]MBP7642989.1 4'-phosphopantetheinyl transferase superfamily protein [Saprospiraceae bacterium]HMS68791.1 4'-phosphopantetheinyl transferase superfamily protein [Saprospiraceae bacterium]